MSSQLVGSHPDFNQTICFNVAKLDFDVAIVDEYAVATVRQTFQNTTKVDLDSKYDFPAFADATLLTVTIERPNGSKQVFSRRMKVSKEEKEGDEQKGDKERIQNEQKVVEVEKKKSKGKALNHVSVGTFDKLSTLVMESRWLQDTFASVREEVLTLHRDRTTRDDLPHRIIDPQLISRISRHVVRRVIGLVRSSRHGATLLFLPPQAAEQTADQNYINIKYQFVDDTPRHRFRTLLLHIIEALSRSKSADHIEQSVGWEDYLASRDDHVAELDEAIVELTQVLASLSAVDGAVVLTRRFEILGFGAEISGELPDVSEVVRSRDAEARETTLERAAGMGTRHRSVYRLCQLDPEALAIVVSQDGGVRFIKQLDGRVAYWDHASIGVRDA